MPTELANRAKLKKLHLKYKLVSIQFCDELIPSPQAPSLSATKFNVTLITQGGDRHVIFHVKAGSSTSIIKVYCFEIFRFVHSFHSFRSFVFRYGFADFCFSTRCKDTLDRRIVGAPNIKQESVLLHIIVIKRGGDVVLREWHDIFDSVT